MRFKPFAKPLSTIFRAPAAMPAAPPDPAAALDSASPDALAAAALGGGAEPLRAAAIRKLEDGAALRQLAGLSGAESASANLARIAQERVAALIDAGRIDFTQLCTPTADVAAVLAVAGFSAEPEHLSNALSQIDDPRQVARLVTEGSSNRIRQLAAQAVSDPAELRQLLKQLRGKDKSVYKIIKHKCDVLRAEEHRATQLSSDAVAAYESLERHSHRIYDVIYEATFRHFDSKWQPLAASAPLEIRESAARAIARCQEIIAEHLRILEAQAAQTSEQAARRAAQEQAEAMALLEAERQSEAAALAATEAAARREADDKARAEDAAAKAHAARQIGGLIAKAQGALREGNTGRASGLRRAIEEKLPTAPAVPAHLSRQVHELDAKLNELKGWKEHAAAPKRAELIAEMEGLIGSSEEPKSLAEKIKQLQEDWKTVSKGIVSESEADWQRFHKASQSAYQPCRAYFEAQSKLREANAEKRKAVLERLRAFEAAQSGEQPDFRTVAMVLREAPLEWRKYFPLDRATGRSLQEAFDESLGRLQTRLDAWHAQNAADKKVLIERARQLQAKDDGREATDGVKRLQAQWKEIGAASRDQEQTLWKEFRAQCDAVFQKRHEAHTQYTAGLEAHKQQALAICDTAERIAAASDAELLEGAGKIAEWRSAFEAVGELPRADQRALGDRLERAIKRCQAAVAQQRVREREQSVVHLFEAAKHLNAYGWAIAQGAQEADREVLKQAADAYIAQIAHWPKGGAQALEDARKKAAASGPDTSAHETALRMLCIRSEIRAERPTPADDQALRREHQMQRLLKGMGQKEVPDELDALALDWVRVGPVDPKTYDALLARFLGCR